MSIVIDNLVKTFDGKTVISDFSIEIKDRTRNPIAPYTTSKLQQAASTYLNYNSSKTMQIAQTLYEGVSIAGESTGLITYMRTDSVRISPVAQEQARDFIKKEFGDKYLPDVAPNYSLKKNAQNAHEAIRPTNVFFTPDSIKEYLKPEQIAGIEELSDDAVVGNEDVLGYLGLDDTILELNLLANPS